MIFMAVTTEGLATAFNAALITNEDSAINAFSNSGLAARNCVPTHAVFEFDLAGWLHLREKMAEERSKRAQCCALSSRAPR